MLGSRDRRTLIVLCAALIVGLTAQAACSAPGEDLFYYPDNTKDGGAQGGSGTTSSTSGPSGPTSSSSTGDPASVSASSTGPGAMCPNGACEPGETFATCPQDCPKPICAHDVCASGDALELGCDPCVDSVCANDDFCCNMMWDDQCIGEANDACGGLCCGDGMCVGESCDSCAQDCGACVCGDGKCEGETCTSCQQDCGMCPPGPTCPHTVCFVGEAIDPALCHDTCVTDVCAQEMSCCDGTGQAWTSQCEQIAAMLCGGPDSCIVDVCAQMPSCCVGGTTTTGAGGSGGAGGAGGAGGGGGSGPPPAWTQACVDLAKTLCATTCTCSHSVCANGGALDVGCNPCVDAVCAADDYCCNGGWDGACVGEAKAICGIDCM